MVGYAYSADYSSDYNYILIKSFDCEDFSLINPGTAYHLYKISRSDYSVLTGSGCSFSNGNLSYKYIKLIADKLMDEEFRHMLPSVISWQITVSGICNVKSTSQMEGVWPLSPVQLGLNLPYVNISDLCFKRSFSKLEASFVVSVINEAAYLCGIYSSDLFLSSGNHIFCSIDFASLIKSVFGCESLMKAFLELNVRGYKEYKLSPPRIIANIKSLVFEQIENDYSYNTILCGIKRECIRELIMYIKCCLEKSISFEKLVRRARIIVGKSLNEIKTLGPDFMTRGNLTKSTDMNYLDYDELLTAFSFADYMRDIPKRIRKNRATIADVKRLRKPEFIYKGKIIFKRCADEN